jgi:hypothetical protein
MDFREGEVGALWLPVLATLIYVTLAQPAAPT